MSQQTTRVQYVLPQRYGAQRPAWYTISDLASEFDVTLRALRFYEAKGLIEPIRQGTSRVYSTRDRNRLQLIITGKQLGFTLNEISTMIADNEDMTAADLKLSPDIVLKQITFLEEQQKTTSIALSELRRRYYLMAEDEFESLGA
jgi:DNA-binding transcriptional MerR regulator